MRQPRFVGSISITVGVMLALIACSSGEEMTTVTDYYAAAASSDRLLADARGSLDEAAIVREELAITDLDTDRHRYTCSETTSRYVNSLRVWLTDPEAGREAIQREAMRLSDGGWVEVNADDRLSESRFFMGPSGFSLRMSVWTDDDDTAGVVFTVDSVCVPNPSDQSSTWGK